jgi:hypothetical protein
MKIHDLTAGIFFTSFNKFCIFLMLIASFSTWTGVALADTCSDVEAYAKSMNDNLPAKADEITTVKKVDVDCYNSIMHVYKEVNVPTTQLDKANPLWKATLKLNFEKLVCAQPGLEALTAYGWKIREHLRFTNNKAVENQTTCSINSRRSASKEQSRDYSQELAQLQSERQQLQESLSNIQAQMEYQEQAKKRQYQGCYGNCLMNNQAGSGFSNALGGAAKCANSCRPLLYGGNATPPDWGIMKNKLESVDCKIRQINEKNFSASCSKY